MTSQMQVANYIAFISKQQVRLTSPGIQSTLLHTFLVSDEPLPLIDAIHAKGMRAGVAISPDTPSTSISDQVGTAADMLLVMTVYPG